MSASRTRHTGLTPCPRLFGLAVLLVALVAIGSAQAQPLPQTIDPLSESVEPEPLFEEPWYTVEVIVFAWPDRALPAHHRSAGTPDLSDAVDPYPEGLPSPDQYGPESEAETQPPAEDDQAIPDGTGEPPVDTTRLPEELVGLFEEELDRPPEDPRELQRDLVLASAWRPLVEDEWLLTTAWSLLESSDRVRPLAHLAWHQPEQPLGDERRVRVRGGDILPIGPPEPALSPGASFILPSENQPEREVDGTVALSQGRYLHFDVDLYFRRAGSGGDLLPGRGIWRARQTPIASWMISERRRVRPGEIHYFDHERFGVIVLVQEFEPLYEPPPEPDPSDPPNPSHPEQPENQTPTDTGPG